MRAASNFPTAYVRVASQTYVLQHISLFYPFVCGCRKGDWCRAEWSEDGIVYEAEVATVNRNQRTAEVVFLGFGNREQKSLDELFMSKGEERRQEQLLASKEADIKEVTL